MSVSAAPPQWRDDVLGGRFASLELPLAADDEGPVVATLVRHTGAGGVAAGVTAAGQAVLSPAVHDTQVPARVVLYLHGWSDYFLQSELADHLVASGFHFYALDLRKFGRSLRDWQTPGYTTDLAVYDEDIAAALAAIGGDIAGRTGSSVAPTVHLLAHSLGGLVAALWADRNPGK
ncbi:MAG TPA: alpha/beta fold hydrolase, partial [Arthrobacter sp.]|nr:alpha/beta fold hydrolase [Arthrobacter sp.]